MNQKRKAEDEGDGRGAPAFAGMPKRVRSTEVGRPLPLPRLLETLDTAQLRTVLEQICDRCPDIGREVVAGAPRPTAANALNVLQGYLETLHASLPYGNSSAEYTYYRVRQPLVSLLDAVSDFTSNFLPPIETHPTKSLEFLDGATQLLHDLPNCELKVYQERTDKAYEDISRAWTVVISEAAKRGGGFVLHTEGWDQKLSQHNQRSGGRLGAAISSMTNLIGWMGPKETQNSSDQNSILNQLISGAYGSPVQVGPW